MLYFPEEVWEHVLSFLTTHRDRNSVSLVCKAWHRMEALTRRCLFIGNCYSVSPAIVTGRFKNLKSLYMKGKPRFSDFGLVPPDWGAYAEPWITALAEAYPWFEELRLKRMVVTDNCLSLVAHCFPNFRALVLTSCNGFSTGGLVPIARRCRHLQFLELQECEIDEVGGHWLSFFPESFTSLISLNLSCTKSEVEFESLERLVARCTSLRSLKLNLPVSFDQLKRLLLKAPQLVDLGTGSFLATEALQVRVLEETILNCKNLQSLSGFCEVAPMCLPALYPICSNLISLNLSYALDIQAPDSIKLISHCYKLQRLSVLGTVGDLGLQAVASTCKELQELRVFPDMYEQASVSEVGIVAISTGCPKLNTLLYFCGKMTNAGLEMVARNCSQLTCFRLCILKPRMPDHVTEEPLDEGFGAIVKCCKNLRRLSLSGLLTDKVFCYIGMYGKQVEMISLAFAGETDLGMEMILEGCSRLRKLEIRDSPFGDRALLSNAQKYQSMRSLWMSSCNVTVDGVSALAEAVPSLNVEVITDHFGSSPVDKLYVYRTVTGKRLDAPDSVQTC